MDKGGFWENNFLRIGHRRSSNVVESNLIMDDFQSKVKKIKAHEWHLWVLAITLILLLSGLLLGTYFFIGGDVFQRVDLVHKVLGGVSVLIILFCAYVVQTRFQLGKMQGIIHKQLLHDDLTSLYNRQNFSLRIREEISRAERDGYGFALLFCDLDRFKEINDSLGYQEGDNVLREVAKNIQDSARGTDLVFRWGGDEFMIVLLGTSREGIMIAADRFRMGIQKIARGRQLDLDMHIGVALYPEHGKTVDRLIGISGRALYIAKKGGDKIHIGDEEYRLDERNVRLVFQPVVDILSNQVLGYEALGRDPQGRISIIELFKKYQSIGQLTKLHCICFNSTLKIAQKAKIGRVFVNVSFEVLSHLIMVPKPPFIEVVLEISEAEVLNDINSHLDIVAKWRKEGYKFAIDDFGAGFISLPFIARLVPEYIKLDRSTILHAVSSSQFRCFLKKLIPALRMYSPEGIIAEGVEKEEELEVVKELGISLIQGFLLGKPKPLL